MQILHICPANVATGGTENIHQLVSELRKCGADAKILYEGKYVDSPQPKQYKKYECPYITEMPDNFKGAVIIPEIFANRVASSKYDNVTTVINWQGVDVYYWSVPKNEANMFLKNKKTLHMTTMDYGMAHLNSFGIKGIHVADCLNDLYFNNTSKASVRSNTVLYNPVPFKLTKFQQIVMAKCQTEYGIKFLPLSGYTVEELIEIFDTHKLYIDFGVFSGRERLPREAAMRGCCVLTSKQGAAGYHRDVAIPDKYKLDNIEQAVKMIAHVLDNYEKCVPDFDEYRNSLVQDKQNYHKEVEELYNAILNNNPGI